MPYIKYDIDVDYNNVLTTDSCWTVYNSDFNIYQRLLPGEW